MPLNRVKIKLDYLLEDIERYVSKALNSIPSHEQLFDERMKKSFLQSINNRLNESFDRFTLESMLDNRLSNKSNDPLNGEIDNGSSSAIIQEQQQHQPPKRHGSRSPSSGSHKKSHKKRRTRSQSSSLSDESTYELEKQNRYNNCICIMNVKQFNPEFDDPFALFGEICNAIGVNIERKDIVTAYRTITAGHIAVKLSNAAIKRQILQCASQVTVYSNKRSDDLPGILSTSKVLIVDYYTPYFLSMLRLAKAFKNRGIIQSFHMESNGLLIKKHERSNGRKFNAIKELTKYLEKRERKQAAKRSRVSSF